MPFRPVALASLLLVTSFAHAEQACHVPPDGRPPAMMLRVDNDLLGGQDEGYTNGLVVTAASPNLVDFTEDPCLPAAARFVNHAVAWALPTRGDARTMSFAFAQGIFTPSDGERTDLIEDDRPYAAALVATFGYHVRKGDRLDSTLVKLGWVGPSARGEQVQHAVHRITGSDEFNGWSNQLHDEAVFQLQKEWTQRWTLGRRSDAFAHWGGSVGTITSNLVGGVQWRYGAHLPDDFGSLPLWAAGDNVGPELGPRVGTDGWRGHVFVGADVRAVFNSISLDGNTWRDSHSVERRPYVGEIGYGFQVHKGKWKFALARYHRTHEFEGQKRRPVFGSFTIGRSL